MSTVESVDHTHGRRPGRSRPDSFSEIFSDALRGAPCTVHGIAPGHHGEPMPVLDWTRPASRSDRTLLGHCSGTTIDIGCGPGRMSAHLASRGHFVLGVDIVREAVEQTRRRGVAALRRNIFDPVPGEGSWDTVLLADGNIGIGGAPHRLLSRAAELLSRTGRVVCDLAAPGTGLSVHEARIATHRGSSVSFPWARVGPEAIGAIAADAALDVARVAESDERWFAVLEK